MFEIAEKLEDGVESSRIKPSCADDGINFPKGAILVHYPCLSHLLDALGDEIEIVLH